MHFCVRYDSQNKYLLFPKTALKRSSSWWFRNVYVRLGNEFFKMMYTNFMLYRVKADHFLHVLCVCIFFTW